jgi:hypothetical protein
MDQSSGNRGCRRDQEGGGVSRAVTRLSKPIETVGSPSPIAPFKKPASRR